MVFVSILLFFAITWGLGYGVTRFVSEAQNVLERNIMRLGFGLALLQVLGLLFHLLSIPLDIWLFLAAALVGPLYSLIRQRRISVPVLLPNRTNIAIACAVLIFAVSLFIYATGAFSYPYLENDDPWVHATGAKFVSVEKTLDVPEGALFNYLDPYPPGYDMTMGIVHQANDSLYWTLKFFNALIISLSLLFFFFMARELSGNIHKALFATFVLAAVPAYLSHFIWAHALVMALFFPTAYAFMRMRTDERWAIVAALCTASLLLVQPTQPFKMAVLIGLFVIVHFLVTKKIRWPFIAAPAAGFLFALFWWLPRWNTFFFGIQSGQRIAEQAASQSTISYLLGIIPRIFPADSGTASRAYTFADFFFAQSQNLINNPVGIGVVVSLLVLAGLVAIAMHRKTLLSKHSYQLVLLLWLGFTFLGVNSITFNLPVGLFAFRFWMLLAVPVALVAAEGLWLLLSLVRSFKVPLLVPALIILVCFGIIFTSGVQKKDVNTAQWPPGAFWSSVEEIQTYLSVRSLPPDTRVFSYTGQDTLIGLDKFSCSWCAADLEMKKTGITQNTSAADVVSFLRENQYPYIIIGGIEARVYGPEPVNALLQDMSRQPGVRIAQQSQGAVIFQVA